MLSHHDDDDDVDSRYGDMDLDIRVQLYQGGKEERGDGRRDERDKQQQQCPFESLSFQGVVKVSRLPE